MKRIATSVVALMCAVAISACSPANVDRSRYAGVDDAIAQRMYLNDQVIAVGASPMALGDRNFRNFVATQTAQICDAISTGTSFDELVRFMDRTFELDNAGRFVSNAVAFGCPQRL